MRINYARAAALSKTVESILTKGRGRVVADTATNSLIITDTRSRVGQHRRLRARPRHPDAAGRDPGQDHLRRPHRPRAARPQVRPRHQLASSSTSSCSGPTRPRATAYDPSTTVVDLGGNSVAGVAQRRAANISSSALDLVFSTALGGFDLTIFLQARWSRCDLADVQAEPIITTLDNRQADILVGEEMPVRVVDDELRRRGGPGTSRHGVLQARPASGSSSRRTSPTTGQILMALRTERSAVRAAGRPRTSGSSSPSSRPTTSSSSTTARRPSSAA